MINNYIRLTGSLDIFKFQEINSGYMLKGRLKIPEEINNSNNKKSVFHTTVNIMAWGDTALALSKVEGEWVTIEGNIETNKYDKRCNECGVPNTAYWTQIRISNFVLANKPYGDVDYIYE